MFEFTENEQIVDPAHLEDIVHVYRGLAGCAGLNLLAGLSPDIVKIDMKLIRGIEAAPRRQAILRAVIGLAGELGMKIIAEGVETPAEFAAPRSLGIPFAQGAICSPARHWKPCPR